MDEKLVTYLRENEGRAIDDLQAFLRIPSVSTDPAHRPDIDQAARWVADRLRSAGPVQVEIQSTERHPVVYAEWLGQPGRPTVLVYGHYDVQPPDPEEEWQTPPFEPDIRNDRIYARGVSDDKGPMLIPIEAMEALFAIYGELPLNIKMIFEGEEEIGSPSLDSYLREHADQLAADFVLSADGAMWRASGPSVNLGSRGLTALNLEIQGAAKDLHSGRHGGAVQNPLHALVDLLAGLHRPSGTVAVEGFYDEVVPPSAELRQDIAALDVDEGTYARDVGVSHLVGEPGYGALERAWIRPTLEINGIGGGYQGAGSKTVIPARAQAKITCRLVPDQDPARIAGLVTDHLRTHTPPGFELTVTSLLGGNAAYRIPPDHPGLAIAGEVLRRQFDQEPAMVLMGGSLPLADLVRQRLGIDLIFFSFSTADEDFHAPNEFFRLDRFRTGILSWVDLWESMARTGGAGQP